MTTSTDKFEAECPGQTATAEQIQMICCRYYNAARFVPGKTVLEVGCGPGIGLGYLNNKGAKRVVGGDYSEANVRLAQKYYSGRVNLTILDAQNLPFKDNCFDEIILFEVIYYIPNQGRFLDECQRILRPNGILILCLANKDLPGFRSSQLSTRYFSVPELHAILNRHNFNTDIFGAFPITRGTTFQKLRARSILLVSRTLNHVPGGRSIKKVLNKIILGKTILIREEIRDVDMVTEQVQLIPIPSDIPDFRHKVLYALSRPENHK